MSGGNSDLAALETLLNEFFSQGTPPARQREIETILLGFGSQQGAWNHCLNFLSNTSNQFVSMFCLTTIETVIHRQWQGLPWEERTQIKASLNNFAIQHHRSMPPFLRNKLVKLIVDIARQDWPHFYPDFLNNVIELIGSGEHTALGLVFARTTSEELGVSREDLTSARREELRRLLLARLPMLLCTITELLDSLFERQKHKRTSTPPPSPTHGQPETNPEAAATHSGSLLTISGMLAKLGSSEPQAKKIPADEEEAPTLSLLALQAVTHLLSWMPLGNFIVPMLVDVLFKYASMPQVVGAEGPQAALSIEAMSAVNELLYKQCIPAHWLDLLLKMFDSASELLKRILSDGLDTVEETYLKKLSEFLCLFVGSHLHRFETNERFSLSEFLSLLYRFTFQQPELEGQAECLEMWCQLARYRATIMQDRSSHLENKTVSDVYREAFVTLTAQILTTMQFRHNQARLEELDDENMDDDDQTEWQRFLCQNIETIAKVADLYPLQIYPMVLETWESASLEYIRLGDQAASSTQLQEHGGSRLHCVLRDLSSLSQALGRLRAGLEAEPAAAMAVAQRLVQLGVYGAQAKLYMPAAMALGTASAVLQPDLLAVHAHVLAALKAWAPWLGSVVEARGLALDAARAALLSLGGPEQAPPPPLVAHAAAHLLLSLTSSLRVPQLGALPEMQALMPQAPGLPGLPDEARRLVLRALGNTLLLPWPGYSEAEQQWQQRQALYGDLVSALTVDLQGLIPTSPAVLHSDTNLCNRVPRLVVCLRLLADQVDNVAEEGAAVKRMLASTLAPALQQCLELFPAYVGVPVACEALLQLFLAVFGSLQPQFGASFSQRMAQVFLEVFTGERLAMAVMQQEAGQGPGVLDKFLKILQLMIQEPGQAFKQFVPSTITLCMDHIFPLVSERQCPDVKLALLELLAQVLMHNWRLFFRSGSQGGAFRFAALQSKENSGEGANSPPQEPPVQHKEQLLRILRAFGHCLLQPDPAACRLSLESLEALNTKYKLYHKAVFREELLPHFLSVLLGALVERTHQLLQEEIIGALHSMASVDMLTFNKCFLPSFLGATSGLDDNQRHNLVTNFKLEMDLPSFSHNVIRLVNDLRCYRLCNASLPEGSIQLS